MESVWLQLLQLEQKASRWELGLYPPKKVQCMTTLKTQSLTQMSKEHGSSIKNQNLALEALKTEFTEKIHEAGVMEMTDMMKIQDLYFGGDMNAAPALTGQSAGLIDTVKPVAQIIDETIDEFNEACKRMSAQKF
jgi:NAD(P)H-dependent flavin oxidoreductase YrpB (nitropropane dioxygenase family)